MRRRGTTAPSRLSGGALVALTALVLGASFATGHTYARWSDFTLLSDMEVTALSLIHI